MLNINSIQEYEGDRIRSENGVFVRHKKVLTGRYGVFLSQAVSGFYAVPGSLSS